MVAFKASKFVWPAILLMSVTMLSTFRVASLSCCTACSACEPECPNVAIREKGGTYVIDPKKCTECEGHYDEPQCIAVCPVDGCIVKV